MLIDINETEYVLDLSRAIELMRLVYKQLSSEEGLKTVDGKTLKLKSGVTRTAIKAIITPIIIPQLERMYAEHNIILEKPVKHTDLIDYAVNALLDFLLVAGESTHAIFTSETRENSRNAIISVVASWEEKREPDRIEATESSKDV